MAAAKVGLLSGEDSLNCGVGGCLAEVVGEDAAVVASPVSLTLDRSLLLDPYKFWYGSGILRLPVMGRQG